MRAKLMLVANSIKSFAINTGIITMKTLQELFELQGKAVQMYSTSHESLGDVFFSYSGHVNQMDVSYYPLGWDKK
jgi:vacuolar-type H+-ATPase catalytic subunit A/Vma1